jgi:hypothetical protein
VKGDGGYSDGNENQREHTMDCWAGTTELDVGANVISTTIIEKDRPAPSMKFKDLAAGTFRTMIILVYLIFVCN